MSCGVGTAKRSSMANSAKVPGAGTYETPSKIVEGSRYSMAGKVKSGSIFKDCANPGPGTYTSSQVGHPRSASYSLKGKHKIGTQLVVNPEGQD